MTPEQEEQVRRALAAAPPAGAMPAEVASRLDASLADLVAARSSEAPDPSAAPVARELAPVVALEGHRRRRWPRVLVAAAGVSVLAYGAGVALDGLSVSGGGADSTAARDETFAGAGAESADGGSAAAPEDAATALVPQKDELQGSRTDARALLVPGTVRLRTDTLDEDVRRLVQGPVPAPDARTPASGKGGGVAGVLDGCDHPDLARGDRLADARLDGRRATLVLRAAVDGARVVQVYACDDASRLLASIQVPQTR